MALFCFAHVSTDFPSPFEDLDQKIGDIDIDGGLDVSGGVAGDPRRSTHFGRIFGAATTLETSK